jgi:alginate O-acetyltransferase complex protein AlgI
MCSTITANYIFSILIFKSKQKNNFGAAKIFVSAAVFFNLLFWLFFRYAGFIIKSANIYPPFGISFYTLFCLSYIFDVYNKSVKAQKNIISLGVYVSAFPKLITGPVCKYYEAEGQLTQRKESVFMFACGIRTFICGLCKKVLFADTAGAVFSYIKALPESDITTVGAWFGLIAFGLYVYFEFSGYFDMAAGLGKMFGFEFPENFKYPFVSKSISEFCRKWHITLFDWFREYIYHPLKKNKKGIWRYMSIAAVSVLAGFWHGANWNYLILGAYFGIILILEKRFFLDILKKAPAVLGYIYSWIFMLLGFLIFAFEDMQKGFIYFGKLFGFSVKGFIDRGSVYDLFRYLPFLALALIGCTPLPKRLFYKLTDRADKFGQAVKIAFSVISAALFLICAAFLIDFKL